MIHRTRRTTLKSCLAASLALLSSSAWAAPFPTRPVTLVVAYPAGGEVDVMARLLAEKLSAKWKQPVVVENRNGAAGTIGSAYVARSAPDGHTLLVAPNTFITAPLVLHPGSGAKYDPITDFSPIAHLCDQSLFVVVNKVTGVRSMQELVARVNEGKVSAYASPGNGSPMHILGELLSRSASITLTQIPYRGTAPGLADVLAGQVPMLFGTMQSIAQYLPSGNLVALAVADTARSPFAPAVPTLAEAGFKNAEISTWQGFLGPKGMPDDLVRTLNQDVNAVLAMPDVASRMKDMAMIPGKGDAPTFARILATDAKRYKKLVEDFRIQPD